MKIAFSLLLILFSVVARGVSADELHANEPHAQEEEPQLSLLVKPTMSPAPPHVVVEERMLQDTVLSPTQSVDVLLKFILDFYPQDTGWKIETMEGEVVHIKPAGTYRNKRPGSVVEEKFTLEDKREYRLSITDIFCDGIGDISDCVFSGELLLYRGLVEDPNQVIAGYKNTVSPAPFEWSTAFRTDTFIPPAIFSGVFPIPVPTPPTDWPTILPSIAPTTPTSGPSSSPAPSMTSRPSVTMVSVLLKMSLDFFPCDTGWRIENGDDGNPVYEKPHYTYCGEEPGAVIEELLILEDRREYVFVITDWNCNGFGDAEHTFDANLPHWAELRLYRGDVEDPSQIIASYTDSRSNFFECEWNTTFRADTFLPPTSFYYGFPTNSPTVIPSSSPVPSITSRPTGPSVEVLLKLVLDDYPYETGWRIENDDGDSVYDKPIGTYRLERGAVIEEHLVLEDHQEYHFFITDSEGRFESYRNDHWAEARLYRGKAVNTDQILAGFSDQISSFRAESVCTDFDPFFGGRCFQSEWNTTFRTDEFLPATIFSAVVFPTVAPSSAPSSSSAPSMSSSPTAPSIEVLLKFNLDSFPDDLGWWIQGTPDGEIIYSNPVGTYENKQAGAVIEELLILEDNREFVFYIVNDDGFGADIPDASDISDIGGTINVELRLYRGAVEDPEQVLAIYSSGTRVKCVTDTGERTFTSRCEWHTTFATNETLPRSVVPLGVFPTASPTNTPSVSLAPSMTSRPSSPHLDVLLMFALDESPGDKGWRIESADGNIVYSKPGGTYEGEVAGAVVEELLTLVDHHEYFLYITDDLVRLPLSLRPSLRLSSFGELRLYRGGTENTKQMLAGYSDTLFPFMSEWSTSFRTDEVLPETIFPPFVYPTIPIQPGQPVAPAVPSVQLIGPTSDAEPVQPIQPIHLATPPPSPPPAPPPTPPPTPPSTAPPTAPTGSLSEPAWWARISANFIGDNLQLCKKRKDMPPDEGRRCQREAKTCFFGVQQCPNGVGPHPVTRCYCDGLHGDQVWRCNEMECPSRPTGPIE